MKELICILFGHRWAVCSEHREVCLRCDMDREIKKVEPVSTLDEIIHGNDWYKPRDLKKERAK